MTTYKPLGSESVSLYQDVQLFWHYLIFYIPTLVSDFNFMRKLLKYVWSLELVYYKVGKVKSFWTVKYTLIQA